MLSFNFRRDTPLNILCLGAHCDDIEIGAGGTLLKIISEYKIGKVLWEVFASNEARKAEAESSAEKFLADVAGKKVNVHSYRDGFLPFQAQEIKEYFESLKTEISPDLILTHYRNDLHQDHRLINQLTWNTWRDHLILEYEIPKYDGDMGVPNFYVSLDENHVARKSNILIESFASQRSKHWFSDETFRALPRLRGVEAATVFAEAFYARKIIV